MLKTVSQSFTFTELAHAPTFLIGDEVIEMSRWDDYEEYDEEEEEEYDD